MFFSFYGPFFFVFYLQDYRRCKKDEIRTTFSLQDLDFQKGKKKRKKKNITWTNCEQRRFLLHARLYLEIFFFFLSFFQHYSCYSEYFVVAADILDILSVWYIHIWTYISMDDTWFFIFWLNCFNQCFFVQLLLFRRQLLSKWLSLENISIYTMMCYFYVIFIFYFRIMFYMQVAIGKKYILKFMDDLKFTSLKYFDSYPPLFGKNWNNICLFRLIVNVH